MTTAMAHGIPTRAVRARRATAGVFVLHAALFASWTPHIPRLASDLHLSAGALGVALLGAPLGSVVAMVVCGALIARWGSATMMRATLVGYVLVPVTIGLADSMLTLLIALTAWGLFQGSLDVAMNAHAGSVESHYGRSIFASFHACWSAGAVVGVGIGSVSVAAGVPLALHMLVLGLLMAAVALPMTRWALPRADDPNAGDEEDPRRVVRPTPGLVGLGLIIFCGLLCEGATADWSALYLRDGLGVPDGSAGLGYAAFAGAMFAGRVVGDRLIHRVGPRLVVRAGTGAACVGMAVGLLVGAPVVSMVAFGVLGIGLSLVVPAVLSASTRVPGAPPAPSLAMTSAFGWVGFLCGPPAIGALAAAGGITRGLLLLPALCLVMSVLTLAVPLPRHQTPTRPRSTDEPTTDAPKGEE